MTLHPVKFLPLIAGMALLSSFVSAQSDTNTSTNTQPPPPPPGENRGGPREKLTKEEWAKLKAAHDKAIAQDPTLETKIKAAHEAMDAARQAMHDAILKADPSIAPILEKIEPPKPDGERGGRRDGKNGGPDNRFDKPFWKGGDRKEGHELPPGFANLTDAEREQLKAAHQKVQNDPSVVAAKQAEQSATNPQERHAAREALRKTVDEAMLKADPSLKTILDKIKPPTSDGEGSGSPEDNGPGGGPPPPPPE